MSSSSPTSSLRKKPSLRGRVFSGSRKPISIEPNPGEHPIAVLRIQVIGCKELPAADMNGKSDPYVVLTFARSRQKTPVISKTLTPVYDPKTATFDFPMYGSVLEKVGSLVEVVVWDKDVIGKDYLGELALPACDWFKHNGGAKAFISPANKDFWLPLVSSRAKRDAKGQIHLKLGFTAAPGSPAPDFDRVYNEHVTGGRSGRNLMSAPPTEGFGTLGEHAAVDAGNDSDDSEEMAYTPRQRRTSTLGLGLTSVPEHSQAQSKVTRTGSTSMKKLPTFRLNWSGTRIDYSFGAHHDVEGIVLLEVRSAANLPKLAGGVSKLVGGSWDMDPFVIVNFNRKAFRTRVIRHSLEPEWNEKIMFHVRKADLEEGAKITLSVLDWDKFQSNDYVGDATIDLAELMARAPKPDPKTGLFAADDDLAHGLKDMVLPLNVSKDVKTDGVKPSIYVRIKYDPHAFLRQRFWRATLHRSDADNNGSWSRAELSEFLDKNGLSLAPEAVSKFFDVRGKDEITLDEAVESLEQAIGLRLEKGQRPEWAPKAQASPVSPTAVPAVPSPAPAPAPEPVVESPVAPAPLASVREVEPAPAECEPESKPPVEAAEPGEPESEPVIELVEDTKPEEPAPKPEEASVEPESKPEPVLEPQPEVETVPAESAPAEPAPAEPAPIKSEPEPTTERAVEPAPVETEPEHAPAPKEAPAPTEPAVPAPAVSEPTPEPQPPVETPAPVVPEPAPEQDTTTTPATPDEFVMVPKDEPEDSKPEAAPDVKPVVEPTTPEPEPQPVVELATPAPAPVPQPPVEVVAPAPPPPVEVEEVPKPVEVKEKDVPAPVEVKKKDVPAPVEVKENEVPAPVEVKEKEVPAPAPVQKKEAPPAVVGYMIEEDVVAPAPAAVAPCPPPPKAEPAPAPAPVVIERVAPKPAPAPTPAPAPSRETKKEKSLPGHYEPNGHAANGHAVTKPTDKPTNTRADEMNKHGQGKGKTKTKAPPGGVELSPAQSDLATSYAALVLADAGVAVSGANILALASAAGIALEPFWAEIFARGLEGQDVKSLLLNVGVGSGAPAASAAPAAGAAVVCAAEPEKEKEEEKVESDDEGGFGGLFD